MNYSRKQLIRENRRNKFLFFWGHQRRKNGEVSASCFSQWWTEPFTVNNVKYASAEHWMMAHKAELFGDLEAKQDVLLAKTPGEAKQIGRRVKNFDPVKWDNEKYSIVINGNLHKFRQSPQLKEFLVNTGKRVLVEASPVDRIWGIGLSADDEAASNPIRWKGENLLGFVLMEVRDILKMRKNRAEKARETLQILDRGWYTVNDVPVDISQEVKESKENTELYAPDKLDELVASIKLDTEHATVIEVVNETTMEGAKALYPESNKVGVLNFASAKNPGGGFMGGAQAQEESLARSSSLYLSIDPMQEMYDYNRAQRTYVYSDYMIYSEGVVFFRNDEMEFVEPYQVDVLTSPAVNVGAMLQNNRSELAKVDEAMLKRLDKLLAVFVKKGVKHLVLGAWGCGVFQNDPKNVVRYFEHFLKNEGKYAKAFETVRFSVLDSNNRGIYDCFTKLSTRNEKK